METLELNIFLFAALIIADILARFVKNISLPLMEIATSMLIALIINLPLEQDLDLKLLLVLFITHLHFNESRHVDSRTLLDNRWGIISLSIGLVFAIIVLLGLSLHWLIPTVLIALALAFGAAVMGFLAWLVLVLVRRGGIDNPTLYAILELIMPFAIYFIAEQFHIGAVIVVAVAGMVIELLSHKHTTQTAKQKNPVEKRLGNYKLSSKRNNLRQVMVQQLAV